MNIEQLRTELSTIGTVGFCDVIDNQYFAIGMIVNEETQDTLDTFDSIVSTYVTPTYPTILARVIEGNSIKAEYIK
jgi:hypothetical protein